MALSDNLNALIKDFCAGSSNLGDVLVGMFKAIIRTYATLTTIQTEVHRSSPNIQVLVGSMSEALTNHEENLRVRGTELLAEILNRLPSLRLR